MDFRMVIGDQSVGLGSDVAVDLGAVGSRRLKMRVAGTERIDQVEVLRNNVVVYSTRPATEDWAGEWIDETPAEGLAFTPTFEGDRPFVFYYMRVRQRNRQLAWSSPIWLTAAGTRAATTEVPVAETRTAG